MVRWRYALAFAVLLLLPHSAYTEDQDEDGPDVDPEDDNENSEEDGEDDQKAEKVEAAQIGRRAPVSSSTTPKVVTRTTTKKRPLECYVCSYKYDAQLLSCLNPAQYNVKTMTCHHTDEKCFTSVISKDTTIEAVVRGCRTSCVGSPDTTCCETNRCNNQHYPTPIVPKALQQQSSMSSKSIPHSILFFVTILLVLQTVVKVTIL